MFKADISMHDFTRLFSQRNPEVLANKRERFTKFLEAAGCKQLFDRPDYTSTWVASFSVMPAILDRLQSSYADHTTHLTRHTRHSALGSMVSGKA